MPDFIHLPPEPARNNLFIHMIINYIQTHNPIELLRKAFGVQPPASDAIHPGIFLRKGIAFTLWMTILFHLASERGSAW